jgi:hypothetical protein
LYFNELGLQVSEKIHTCNGSPREQHCPDETLSSTDLLFAYNVP